MLYLDLCMGWLRLVGSLKLSISFAEYRLFYRALLQKRPIFSGNLRVYPLWCNTVDMLYLELYMGWLRLVGSLKLQVSFAKYRLFYKALWYKTVDVFYLDLCMGWLRWIYSEWIHS